MMAFGAFGQRRMGCQALKGQGHTCFNVVVGCWFVSGAAIAAIASGGVAQHCRPFTTSISNAATPYGHKSKTPHLLHQPTFGKAVQPKKCGNSKSQKYARNYCCCERIGQSRGQRLWPEEKCTCPPFCNFGHFGLGVAVLQAAQQATEGKWRSTGWQGRCHHVPGHGHGHGGFGHKTFLATGFFYI